MSYATLIAGGDVQWWNAIKPRGIYYDREFKTRSPWQQLRYGLAVKLKRREPDWSNIPYVASDESRAFLERTTGRKVSAVVPSRQIPINIAFESPEQRDRYPFQRIAPLLHEADVTFVNLETPLSDHARYSGVFRAPTSFARALKEVGIDVVSTANNHALDAEGEGLRDTLAALAQAGVASVGTGENLSEARRPCIVEREGVRIAFLAYSFNITGFGRYGFAQPDLSGVAPMDPFVIREDVSRVRDEVDVVVLALHWGYENRQTTHPAMRRFGRSLIDAGADLILGTHPHVPRGIEAYRGKAIVYSLGNFIFSYTNRRWMDNYLVRVMLGREGLQRLEVLPIAGAGNDVAQPFLLGGERAGKLLANIRALSADLDTTLAIEGDTGVIRF